MWSVTNLPKTPGLGDLFTLYYGKLLLYTSFNSQKHSKAAPYVELMTYRPDKSDTYGWLHRSTRSAETHANPALLKHPNATESVRERVTHMIKKGACH